MYIFPLPLVIIQAEVVPLHIFEERYKKLILYCLREDVHFVIPAVHEQKILYSGAEMVIDRIANTYAGGEMDIVCRAVSRVQIHEIFEAPASNEAATALVSEKDFLPDEDKELELRLQDLLTEFYQLAGIQSPVENREHFGIADVYHKCGLSFEQELELAELESTRKRQYYLVEHLKHTIKVLHEVEKTRLRIRMNGHFKKLPQSQ